MFKKGFNRLAMIMLMAVLPIAFASCSDNEEGDEPKLPQPEVEGLLVTYSAQIDSAMLDYLDMTVEYIDYHGQTVSIALDDKQWTQAVAFDREKGEMPANLAVRLKMAKKQLPEFEGAGVHIYGKVEMLTYTIFSDGTSKKSGISGGTYEEMTIPVDKLDVLIDKTGGTFLSYEANDLKYSENGEIVNTKE